MKFADCTDGDRDPQNAADDRSGEEPGLPCCTAEDGTDHGAHACQRPASDEYRDRLQGLALLPKVVCSPNGSRLSCGRNTRRRKAGAAAAKRARRRGNATPPYL